MQNYVQFSDQDLSLSMHSAILEEQKSEDINRTSLLGDLPSLTKPKSEGQFKREEDDEKSEEDEKKEDTDSGLFGFEDFKS